ncbi:MAG: type II toxin-antitoxin system VapB family antitoxin [Gammaproteobacteria bacterium]|nr:type II toxin-antitoxin system VapB family antitoxin [Gammaproteobacteria bacterium]MCY4181585.1 type II toxin-antitoxin system VapB family antitoxin [Gammaproteobacteria bacterium]MCY4269574.1 type II toxin-antitoxin system VapB family antitoxin [Gammaproteobacteria bacterium]MCY4295631.1 type II toxin-antitoxin system VapB family antitoxin [Gammaproteobacteria bacterium]
MATNLGINPELLRRALELGGEKTKRATVDKALREFIAWREQRRLLELFQKLDWSDDYDYKAGRSRS